MHVLDRLKPGRPGSLKEPLHKLAEHYGRRGVLVLISDFYEDPETVVEAVKPLRFRGNDIMVFHVLDKDELDFGFADASPFEDLETGEQVPVVPDSLRKEYRAMVQAHIAALTQSFSKVGVDYTLFDTSQPLDYVLFRYLSATGAPAQEDGNDRPSMSFLAPLFFVALAGLAIPVLLHLTQKEKKEVVYFPSLMFVRKIPYQASRRRRIQHWFLLHAAPGGAGAHHPGVRAAAADTAGRAGGARAGRARSGGAARHQLQHGLRPALGGGHRSGARRGVAARRRRTAPRSSPSARAPRSCCATRPSTARSTAPSRRPSPARRQRATRRRSRWREACSPSRSCRGAKWCSSATSSARAGAGRRARRCRPAPRSRRCAIQGTATQPNLSVTAVSLQRSRFANQERVTVTAGITNRSETAVTEPAGHARGGRAEGVEPRRSAWRAAPAPR